jgi:hypothetical protein
LLGPEKEVEREVKARERLQRGRERGESTEGERGRERGESHRKIAEATHVK